MEHVCSHVHTPTSIAHMHSTIREYTHVGYTVHWYQLEGGWKSRQRFKRDAPVAFRAKMTGFPSTFKLVSDSSVPYMLRSCLRQLRSPTSFEYSHVHRHRHNVHTSSILTDSISYVQGKYVPPLCVVLGTACTHMFQGGSSWSRGPVEGHTAQHSGDQLCHVKADINTSLHMDVYAHTTCTFNTHIT